MLIHVRLLYVFVSVHAQVEVIERGFVPSKGVEDALFILFLQRLRSRYN